MELLNPELFDKCIKTSNEAVEKLKDLNKLLAQAIMMNPDSESQINDVIVNVKSVIAEVESKINLKMGKSN